MQGTPPDVWHKPPNHPSVKNIPRNSLPVTPEDFGDEVKGIVIAEDEKVYMACGLVLSIRWS